MNKQLLEDLAIKGGIYDCLCDPYDKLGNGDPYSSVMVDLERLIERVVRKCIDIADEYDGVGSTIVDKIQKHFGVEE